VSEVTTYFEWEFDEFAFSFETRSDSHSSRWFDPVGVHYRAARRSRLIVILI
jgi:hypothetical protein